MKSLRDFYFMRAAARRRQYREYEVFRQSLKRLHRRRFFRAA